MDEPTKLLIDLSTGETTTIPLTPDELTQRGADTAAAQAEEQARLDAIAAAEAQHAQAVQTLMAALPSDDARGALAVVLGLPAS